MTLPVTMATAVAPLVVMVEIVGFTAVMCIVAASCVLGAFAPIAYRRVKFR